MKSYRVIKHRVIGWLVLISMFLFAGTVSPEDKKEPIGVAIAPSVIKAPKKVEKPKPKPVVIKKAKPKKVARRMAVASRGGRDFIEVYALITGYCPCKICTNKGPGHPDYRKTASGPLAVEGRTMAAPPSIPYGSTVLVPGVGQWVIEDRGGAIQIEKGIYHFDRYFSTHQEAWNFGKRYGKVRLYIN